MTSKFEKLFESYSKRYELGGFLVGDFVVFRPDYKNCDCYKAMNSAMKENLDSLVDSGTPLRVSGLGNKYGSNTNLERYIAADDVVVTVSVDEGGGRWMGKIAVAGSMLDISPEVNPYADVETKGIGEDGDSWTHEKYVTDDKHTTRVTDQGTGKNKPTNLKLKESLDTVVHDFLTND